MPTFGTPPTAASAPRTADPDVDAGAYALRLAGRWLAVYAVVLVAVGLLFTLLIGALGGSADMGGAVATRRFAVTIGAAGSGCAFGLAAILSWRAATPGRVVEGVLAFLLGSLALGVASAILLMEALDTAMWWGLDMRIPRSGPLWAAPIVVGAPAALMVIGTLHRWCASGDARRTHLRAAAAVGGLALACAVVGGVVVAGTLQSGCEAGRSCVPAAGISFVRPAGWSRLDPEEGQLYAATPSGDQTRVVIEDGAAVLGDLRRPVPSDMSDLETSVVAALEGGGGFGHNDGVTSRQVALPVGPAVRVAYTHTTAFILAMRQTSITYWLRVGDHLVVVEYMHAYGEGTPGSVEADPPDLTAMLASIQPL